MSGEHWIGKFQKARIIRVNDEPALLHREIWLKVGPPEVVKARDVAGVRAIQSSPCYATNLYDDYGNPVFVGADQLELLARGPFDFADRVNCVYWKTFRDVHTP